MIAMLRDENQTAINEIIVACQEIINHYRYAAEILEDDELVSLFKGLADEREILIERLIECFTRTGELHDVPDSDKELLLQLFSRIKTLFAEDSRMVFIEERVQAEHDLERMLASALQLTIAADIREALLQLSQHVEITKERLPNIADSSC